MQLPDAVHSVFSTDKGVADEKHLCCRLRGETNLWQQKYEIKQHEEEGEEGGRRVIENSADSDQWEVYEGMAAA